ncbi:MAG: monovalent cation/H+ antiporter complex subunit F [Eubacteriales bacterium]|nr:monovalent cation/H+ antiporter complex subunit F [Eubacteriales bacterium]
MTEAYNLLFTVVLAVLGVLLFLCLLRAILGPRIADRVVGINMIGTIIILMIAILALMLGEGYLVDIAIIYAMLSFLAVVVLAKIYIGVYRAQRVKEEEQNDDR